MCSCCCCFNLINPSVFFFTCDCDFEDATAGFETTAFEGSGEQLGGGGIEREDGGVILEETGGC